MTIKATVRGNLKDDGTLELSRISHLPPGPVRVTVEPLPSLCEDTDDVLQRIWAERKAKGIAPRSRDEIDAVIESGRHEADAELESVERFHQAAREAKD